MLCLLSPFLAGPITECLKMTFGSLKFYAFSKKAIVFKLYQIDSYSESSIKKLKYLPRIANILDAVSDVCSSKDGEFLTSYPLA